MVAFVLAYFDTTIKSVDQIEELTGLPILGRVGMKNFVIDITGKDIKVGDKVKIDINLILCNQEIERTMI